VKDGTAEITALKSVSRKARANPGEPRCLVELDGSPWEEIEGETVLRHGLKRGRRLSPDERRAILRFDEVLRAKRWAAGRCAMKPRSRRLLEQELRKRKYAESAIQEALNLLEASGTVNDAEVAARHLRKRARAGGYGPARLRTELSALGVSRATVEAAMTHLPEDLEPGGACLALARKRVQRYRPLAEMKNRNRLMQFLQRRGYDGELIQRTLETLLAEFSDEPEGSTSDFRE
jgi:regulatory protein